MTFTRADRRSPALVAEMDCLSTEAGVRTKASSGRHKVPAREQVRVDRQHAPVTVRNPVVDAEPYRARRSPPRTSLPHLNVAWRRYRGR